MVSPSAASAIVWRSDPGAVVEVIGDDQGGLGERDAARLGHPGRAGQESESERAHGQRGRATQ